MKVLLVNVPYREVYGSITIASGQYFPLGLGYIAAYLQRAGHDALLLDPEAQGTTREQLLAHAREFAPDAIGLNATTPTIGSARRLAAAFRESLGDVKIVLGGVHPTAMKETILDQAPEADFAVFGEGEQTFTELLGTLRDPAGWQSVDGLCHRAGGGNNVNRARAAINDLDSLPFPARAQLDLSRYRPNIYFDTGQPTATLMTSRGCPYDCTFCSTCVILGSRFRAHSPAFIMDEIGDILSRFRARHLLFHDDTLTLNKKRAHEIFGRLAAHSPRLRWSCFAHLQTVDAEMISEMKKSGCRTIGFGVESADETVRRNLGKTHTNELAVEVFRNCRRAGIRTLGFFIIGGPGETAETAEATISLARKLNPVFPIFNLLTPYPGTAIFDRYCKPPSEFDYDWARFITADFACSFDAEIFREKPTTLSRAQLKTLLRRAAMRSYVRPAYVLNQLLTMPGASYLKVLAKGALGFVNYILSARDKTGAAETTK